MVLFPTPAFINVATSDGRHPTQSTDYVSNLLCYPTSGLSDLEGPCEQVVEGAITNCYHSTGQADDIVGHAEIRCG